MGQFKNNDGLIKKTVLGILVTVILVALDQLTKLWAVSALKGNDAIVIWPGVFELRYLENRGAAFGILQGRKSFFVIFTIIVLALILWLYIKRIPVEQRFFVMNFVCVLFTAGAIGNFIDRVIRNYVVDFFYFCLIDFPIFNVADIYVTVAAFLIILFGLFYYKEADYERIFPSSKK